RGLAAFVIDAFRLYPVFPTNFHGLHCAIGRTSKAGWAAKSLVEGIRRGGEVPQAGDDKHLIRWPAILDTSAVVRFFLVPTNRVRHVEFRTLIHGESSGKNKSRAGDGRGRVGYRLLSCAF